MRKMTGMRCFSISSSRKFDDRRVGVRERPVQPLLLLRRGEVRGEEEDLQLAGLVERVGELADLLADAVQLVAVLGDLEQRPCVDRGDLLHQPRRSSPDRDAKSSSDSASSTSRFWSSLVERLARDLLGGEHGEVGDLGADLLDRAARLGLDVACASAPSSPRAWRCASADDLGLRVLAGLARAGDDLVRLRRGPRRAARGTRRGCSSASRRVCSASSIDSSIARWRLSSASAMRGNASLLRMNIEMPKTSSVQIISPMSGETRKLPPPPRRRPPPAARTTLLMMLESMTA